MMGFKQHVGPAPLSESGYCMYYRRDYLSGASAVPHGNPTPSRCPKLPGLQYMGSCGRPGHDEFMHLAHCFVYISVWRASTKNSIPFYSLPSIIIISLFARPLLTCSRKVSAKLTLPCTVNWLSSDVQL